MCCLSGQLGVTSDKCKQIRRKFDNVIRFVLQFLSVHSQAVGIPGKRSDTICLAREMICELLCPDAIQLGRADATGETTGMVVGCDSAHMGQRHHCKCVVFYRMQSGMSVCVVVVVVIALRSCHLSFVKLLLLQKTVPNFCDAVFAMLRKFDNQIENSIMILRFSIFSIIVGFACIQCMFTG